ncbi:putative helicase MOV-10 [Apostichopus japonicus]|uniref:RNA helicase n=1 Tax=Stichopus japonicus TaxID=307972 RepID=A0A2G8LF59_STIJA|nr:putative helicase MOV-10 [Apostichopus japonicus]
MHVKVLWEAFNDGLTLVPSGQEYEITLRCECRDFGEIRAPVAFGFKLQSTKELFHIFRVVIFSVAGGEDRDILTPTAPYSRTSKVALTPRSSNVLSGTPFTFSGKGKLPQKINMDNYYIPDQVSKSLNSSNPGRIESLQDPLSEENYSQKFENLLYAEEHQMKVDIRRYDKKAAEMSKSRTNVGLLNLKVPGLAENRPSVLRGDHLYATHSDGSRDKSYRGYVHHIEQEVVSLSFHADLVHSFIDKMKFDIQFTFSRFPLKLQHFAVGSEMMDMDEMKAILFPTPKELQGTDPEELQTLRQRQLFNRTLASNTEQVQAIYHILRGSSLPAPYLVFGPPGTGKTVTVVEAMKQVYHQIPDSFILACAPSNSAADLIAKRLLDTGPVAKSHLLRMSALSRSWEAVDPDLKKFKVCLNYDDQGHVVFPGIDALKEKRIVVVTMVTAGRLVLADSFKNHFTHIFLDEAGHAIEPEALISVTGLLPKNGQLVLAGDPKQLGPVLRSPISKQNGLELSLLERLMTTEAAYQRTEGVYNDLMLTKLLCNYRSHPSILCKPNEMFYEGELKVFADEMIRESLSGIDQLPKKGFPVIFHGIEGKDEREESSPSFFNAAEVDQVKKYVDDLLGLRGTRVVKQAQIGVISPYRKQVQKIKKVLARRNLTDIKVGSVEEFQGQERLVIIISTVRSTNKDFLKMDQDYKLGFLQNPKRFNVAITRAKALLICIGNPYMLRKDEHWKQFLDYCRENGGYTGCPYSPEEEEQEIEALSSKMVGLNIVTEMMTVLTTHLSNYLQKRMPRLFLTLRGEENLKCDWMTGALKTESI